MTRSTWIRITSAALAASLGAAAAAQFGDATPDTNIVESLSGQLLGAEGAPTPEPGDQIGAFFGDQLLAVFTFTSTQTDPLAWDMIVAGDDPETTDVKEGPGVGDVVRFRFFDSSTDMTRTDIVPTRQDNGEVITYVFRTDTPTFQLPIDVPGAPPFPGAPGPNIPFNLTLGIAAPDDGGAGGNGGGGNGGGGGSGQGNPDVNGDGRIDKRDAALVMRVMIGASRGVTQFEASRADVNNDGVVDTRDVIAILSKRGGFENTP